MTENGKIVSALVLGAAAGAVLGLLFAPSKGSELIQKIKDGAGDLIGELTEKVKENKETLSELKDEVISEDYAVRVTVEERYDAL